MISGTVMLACGAVGEENAVGDLPAVEEPANNEPAPVNNDPSPVEEPVNNDPAPVEEPAHNDNQSGGDSDYNGDYNNYDNSNNYVEDSDPLYYGDASNYNYNVSDSNEAVGSVSSNTPLYNSSGMSAEDAAPNEWSDIVLDEKTVKTGVADFSAIKSNTEVQDNGDWILYLGYALLALAALGILYFIIATIAHRKAVKKEAARMERRRASSPARSEAARMEARERREAGSQRTSRFADENPGYSRRASSRADTDEVYVPRRVAKKH